MVAKYTRRCALDEHNKLKRDRLIYIIKHYEIYKNVTYKLNALLRYNIDLNPEEITDYVYEQPDTINQFITSEKYLEDLHYNDSINMFQDLNALYFIYIEDQAKQAQAKQAQAKQDQAKQDQAKQAQEKAQPKEEKKPEISAKQSHHTKKIKLTNKLQKTKRNKKNLKIKKE